MKNFKVVVLLISLITLLAACSSGSNSSTETSSELNSNSGSETSTETKESSEPIELTFWNSMGGNAGEGIDEMVKRFNEQSENVKVTAEFQGIYDDALTKLRNATNGATPGADVVQVFEVGARQYDRLWFDCPSSRIY